MKKAQQEQIDNLQSLVITLRDACSAALLSVNLDLGLVDISKMPQSEAKRLIELRGTLSLAVAAVEQSGEKLPATWANAEAGDTIGKPKAQHTPGPWQVHIFRYPNGQLNGTPSVYAPNGNDGGRHVCQVYDNGQLEANARLIAAAPDLLGSLKALFEHCAMVHSVWGDGCNQKQADAAIKAGRDAIAKAEGK